MEIRHLKTFKTIVELGGYTRAADYLGYAQSTVTGHIQAIEQEMGQPLFNRLGKKMVLTDVGKHLLPYANEMIALSEKAKQIPSVDNEITGKIVIGAPESLTIYRLPSILHEYKKKYPKVKITLKASTCRELRNDLKSGNIDIAFLLDTERHEEDLHIEQLVMEQMAFVFPKDYTVTQTDSQDVQFSQEETFLYTERGCSYRAFFEHYLQRQGIQHESTFEFWSIEAIKQCVMCGLGISLLPIITAQQEQKDKKLQAVILNEAKFATQLVYHKNKWFSPALHEFLMIIRKHAKGWREVESTVTFN
ncbi:LysR family transcriptional regulator [Bacillus pseudomycoides]|uniref:HTH-type transcriptional regulator CzcR n=1 Tax=Bacillus pseudomycoides TaxID=64104 RepID=A0A2B5HHD8_9BACI|nr:MULTISPECIES: LysR family transcriptional regulator [Bacillus]MCX2824814.1 LysR family transcriptional regulator [Bacillus sp. DHT2]MDR4915451.1 LysR family transcriptional regulator [Bacillus pseudomycoides]PDX99438.1 LysR family transcriptional regulator [Bacillus pseudomycoides]PDY46635.1 LysR family transcriptional regulator [Bacillus pseudomycoides]PEA80222.1 LysR family transcriptional regulator [Bacillus pseudomycoides]